jgi:hypothetical protein
MLKGASSWSRDYVFLTKTLEPQDYFKTIQHPRWIETMQQEYNSIVKNNTWDLVKLPEGKIPFTTKWVFKIKQAEGDQKERFKACLVAHGCEQRKGIDFEETFAPIIKWVTIRVVEALAAQRKWIICHLDVKTTFLNGELIEEVCMQQPFGFVVPSKEKLVCKLQKTIYGLKQAPCAWY